MTIEEAIGLEKREQIKCENDMKLYKRKLCRKLLVENAEYHKQIAEWLEELKEFKELNSNVIRSSAIDEAMVVTAKAICTGCGYRSGTKCTYTGHNCTVSKPMIEVVMKELEKLKRDKI